ncbi:hypothetical protein [Amycolatopsis kentuckyensis]|uniref:hypothetical protein n=1 Tax=Amycolatopsis kentuckyensis TaxID=218823 RepID=UPI00356B0A4C
MAFQYVKHIGTNGISSTTAVGMSVSVPAGGVPAGDLLVLRFASFNYRSGSTPPTVSDSRGNTWQQDYSRTSSSDGMNVVYSTVVTTPLQAGDLVSVAFSANNANYAMGVDQFTGVAPSGWRFQVDPTGTKAVTATPTNSIAPNTPAPTYTLVLGVLFVPLPSTDSYTESSDQAGGDSWHTLPGAFSPAGTSTQAVRASYKIPILGSTAGIQTWSPVLGTAKTALETLVIYQGQLVPVTVTGTTAAGRTGNPREQIAIDVSLASDVSAASRTGAPESTLSGTVPEPITLLDVPFASRTGAPDTLLGIDVPVASDVPAAARTGETVDEVAVGVTVQDAPFAARTGAPADGPALIGVTVPDNPVPARTGAPGAQLAIGVTLFTDAPAGARSGAPAAAIANTVTNDVPAASRTAAPASALGGAGPFPVQPSSLTGEIPNPNRPLLLVYIDPTVGPPHVVGPGPTRRSLNSRARRTIARKISVQRGRQYELDQVQAGTANIEVTDPLESLNPENPASPLNQNGQTLEPYRAMRISALWPNTGNMINVSMLGTGADPSFETGFSLFNPSGAGTTQATSTAHFWTGTKSMQVTQTTDGRGFGTALGVIVGPDLLMVVSAYVRPTSGTTVQLRVIDAAGVEHLSNVATAQDAWTRVFVSWKAVDVAETLEIFGSGGAPTRFYVDAVQLEYGRNPTAFSTTGPTAYRVYSGYIERYPLHYDMNGTRGIRPLTVVDALAVLSRTEIAESYLATITADGPNMFAPLNDASGPQQIQRPGGGAPMAGYTELGSNSSSVNWAGDSFLDGSPVVSITQQNATPPVKGDLTQTTYIGTRGGAVSMNPRAFTFEGWFRFQSGCVYFGLASMNRGEKTANQPLGPAHYIGLYTTGGTLCFRFIDPNGGAAPLYAFDAPNFPGAYPDSTWHYFAITLSNGSFSMYLDDYVVQDTQPLGFTPSASIQLDNLFFNATTYFGDPVSTASWANFATYPYALTTAQLKKHYLRGVGNDKEFSGGRVGRLLAKYWNGPWLSAGGYLQLAPDNDYNRRMLLDVLQEIQESERGFLYANQGGTVIFDDRSSRYRDVHQIPVAVFGEDVASGEIPYEDYEGDIDPTYTFSQANLTRPGNNDFAPMVNTAAQAKYGQRILSHNVQCTNDFDLTQAGTFYLGRYARAKLRIEKLTINPIAFPSAWATLLGLELGLRVTIRRRAGSVVLSGDYYVEQINHDIDPDAGTWRIDLQCSPVFVPSAWVLGDPQYGVLGSTTTPIY